MGSDNPVGGNSIKQRRYIAWLRIKGGIDRYGSETFKTRREALQDACRIIEEVRNDPAVEWWNEIETYGSAIAGHRADASYSRPFTLLANVDFGKWPWKPNPKEG